MTNPPLMCLVILTCTVLVPVVAITTHANFRKVMVSGSLWQSTQPKEEWTQSTATRCAILCKNLDCEAFYFDEENRNCVTAAKFTIYSYDEVSQDGVIVHVRALEDGSVPFTGGNIVFCHSRVT